MNAIEMARLQELSLSTSYSSIVSLQFPAFHLRSALGGFRGQNHGFGFSFGILNSPSIDQKGTKTVC